MDTRNFRKRLFNFDVLTKTKEIDKIGSKRGAFLYKLNKAKFDKSITKGFSFHFK